MIVDVGVEESGGMIAVRRMIEKGRKGGKCK